MKGVLSVIVLLLCTLAFRYLFFYPESVQKIGESVTLQGILLDEPKRSPYSQRFTFKNITVSVPEYPEYAFGDFLLVKGVVEESTFTTKKGQEVTDLVIRDPFIQKEEQPFLLKIIMGMLKKVTATFTQALPSDEAALLLGITVGVRNEFSQDLLDVFRNTGVMHVVAASGSNVATLTAVVLYFCVLFMRRQLAIFATSLVIIWYAVLAGFDPPIVRASLMAMITLTAQLVGKQNYSLLALIFSAWIMLMIQPQLISDIGFQLSVGATAGIMLAKPILDIFLRFPQVLKDDFSTTLAAQIGTIPILFGAFGVFAPLSILINLLVLWTVPIIMILGLLAALGGLISPVLAAPFAYSAYPFLHYFIWIVSITDKISMPITIPTFNFFLTLSYYMLCISIIILMRKGHHEQG